MKKLMIAAAIVCAAAFAQAANTLWGFSSTEIMAPDNSDYLYENGTAFLFLGTITETDNKDGTWSLNFSKAELIADPAAADEMGTFGPNDPSLVTDVAKFTTAGGQAYSLLLLEGEGITDYANFEGNYVLKTGETAYQQDMKDPTLYYNNAVYKYDINGGTSGDWKTAAVPEPTSGLLLLLGVAGLALRRRRA